MFRSCFCCRPRDGGRSKTPRNPLKETPATAPIKRKYRFHNSVMRHKRNKNHKKISLSHTVFVVPRCVPPCMPTIIDLESPLKISRPTFSMTVIPEIKIEKQTIEPSIQNDNHSPANKNQPFSNDLSTTNSSIARSNSTLIETLPSDPDERPTRTGDRNFLSYTSVSCIKPDIQIYSKNTDIPTQNDKPIAEVKPTKSVQPLTERRKSTGIHVKKQEKRSSEVGPNFSPFNDPQKALQLVSTQINSAEWETAVTALQNISRLSMFHGKELRVNSLQPFVRVVAKHIKSLRSQVARAACTAVQKMFTHVPKSVEPDVEEIASALFPRTADTNKFLRVQSAEAFNAMVDNLNPIKCVHVITSKGIKHGNRLVRAEACRLLARVVDKLGVNGTLHLPTDARDAVITAATSMVLDNTPTSRQAAQHILARLSEDPRGAALISSAASPNVKATLNKSLSRIFLK